MSFQDLIKTSQIYFPNLKIKYKTDSNLMKFLFFNKNFMISITPIGSIIYFPSRLFVKTNPISSSIILLHELVYIYNIKYNFLIYLFPQILSLLFVPLLFIDYKISILYLLISLFIIYIKMYFEVKAYISSLYVINLLGKRLNFNSMLDEQNVYFKDHFKNSYYCLWSFSGFSKNFDYAIEKIKSDKYPYDDLVFSILDDLTTKV